MTDLLSRPRTGARSATAADEPTARPLTVSAAIAGAGAAGATLLSCMALAVVGWFLADAGGHGQTTDALRVGADAWLVGHGSHLTVSGMPIGITPLALTGIFALVAFRSGRWAGATSQPVEDDRSLAVGVTIATGLYVVITVVTCVLAGRPGADPNLGRALVGALVVSGVAGGLGMAIGTARLDGWLAVAPEWLIAAARSGAAAVLVVLAAASALLAASLVLGLNQAATVMSTLHLGTGDALMYTLVVAAVAPNAVLLSGAYLLGPGFAVGTGTIVSPTAVSLGPVPAFPLLAALPGTGPTPWWTVALMALPVAAAGLGVALVQRSHPVAAYDLGALRGAGSGLAAGVALTLLIALAGGPMGTGRMADIGAPLGEVFLTAVAAMSIGGLLGGLLMTWWQRRA